ncbi:MAG: transcription elongation factor [Betaproteobacteria bacterium]|nr:MAG: transcription elongation factor [Betaproteobacteria bacterium]
MPEKKTLEAAQEDKREGKAPTTQAGEFVREEMHHVREGKHGARNPKQAIAIGLSKARRSGVDLPAPTKGQSAETRKKAARDLAKGKTGAKPSPKRSRARVAVLKREGRGAASHSALSAQTKSAAMARKAAARKAARTRARRSR